MHTLLTKRSLRLPKDTCCLPLAACYLLLAAICRQMLLSSNTDIQTSHPQRREAGAPVDFHGEGRKLVPREDQCLQLRSQVVPGQEEVLEAEVR